MKKLTFGVVLNNECSGYLVQQVGDRQKIKFAAGGEFYCQSGVISVIAKEITKCKLDGKEVTVYSLCDGILVSEGDCVCGEKIFASSDLDLGELDEITLSDSKALIHSFKRVKQNLWKQDGSNLKYYNEDYITQYIFEILLGEFEKESDNFSISRQTNKLCITI